MNNELKSKILSLPDSPGVYSMKDKNGKIIYIGKANSLRKRLTSYLSKDLSNKTLSLMSYVSDIDFQLCQNESIALLLEASLIHKYKPKYNVALRDDKSFPYVKITDEEFPAIYISRKKGEDGAHYFGPYTNAGLLREALKAIRRSLPYRSCKKLPKKACIYFRLKLSPAPCIGKIGKAEYVKTIRRITLILKGESDALLKELSQEMETKAKEQRFEEAAILRDKILALSSLEPKFYAAKEAIAELKDILGLKNMPLRIEAFDVSNIFGLQPTASMVSFYNGLTDKDNYRRFRIKTVEAINDYKMLSEAISRRYRRVKEEGLALPDLILIDGGRGQLSAAKRELEILNLEIPIISLAKREEDVYTLLKNNPIKLKKNSAALRLIQHIRDESHRFALKYHHILRRRHLFKN